MNILDQWVNSTKISQNDKSRDNKRKENDDKENKNADLDKEQQSSRPVQYENTKLPFPSLSCDCIRDGCTPCISHEQRIADLESEISTIKTWQEDITKKMNLRADTLREPKKTINKDINQNLKNQPSKDAERKPESNPPAQMSNTKKIA